MQYTDNYQFREPTPAVDIVKVGDINYNSRKIDELIHSTQVSLAPAYDETRTSSNPYMTGDVVMKDALMYRCLDDDVYGAWDATKWERTTAGEEGAGGSSVEANPQGTPTDDLDTISINGTIYNIAGSGGGGGNVYGAFIDTNRVITTLTGSGSGDDFEDYTAVEDCAVIGTIRGNSGAVQIDGVTVAYTSDASETIGVCVYARRGQTVSYRMNSSSTLTLYGLTFGTQNIFTPQIYSTEERVIGVWTDGKPLYQKTYHFTTPITIQGGGSWTNTGIDISFVDYLVNGEFTQTASRWNGISPINNAGTLNAVLMTSGNLTVSDITIQYTKTTDIAGSGSFNTLGIPARHYDTTEKVVGTVEMDNGTIKPLYEKSWWLTIPNQSGGYTFPNTSMADLDQVISNEYSFNGRGMRSYTYWYAGASIVFDEHTSSGISFYFGSSGYSGSKIFYTARYTKTTD